MIINYWKDYSNPSYWNKWKPKLLEWLLKNGITVTTANSDFYISKIIWHKRKNSWHYRAEIIKRSSQIFRKLTTCIYIPFPFFKVTATWPISLAAN